MVFQQLEKAGFVAAQETTRSGQRPERTVYAITDAGHHELRTGYGSSSRSPTTSTHASSPRCR